MARKPADIIAAAPRPEGRQVIWQAMRKLRTFTVSDIEDVTRINAETIRTYIRGLVHAGYLAKLGRATVPPRITTVANSLKPMVYELAQDIGTEAPRVTRKGAAVTQGAATEQMWRTMRILREFDFRDLAINATTEEHPVTERHADRYIKHLHRAGYLVATSPAKYGRSRRPVRYRLLPSRMTGPKPPQVQRNKKIFDPNLGRVVWQGGAA